MARVLELFDTRYWDFTANPPHFHEKLVAEHGSKRSYNWVRLTLQAYGRRRAAPRRGAHRRKRRSTRKRSYNWVRLTLRAQASGAQARRAPAQAPPSPA